MQVLAAGIFSDLIRGSCVTDLDVADGEGLDPISCSSRSLSIVGLASADGLASFRSFLRSEFSEENAEFWVACEDYKKTKSPVKLAEKAKKIYEEFIQTEAPKEVNIDHFTKAMTMKNLVEPSPTSFDMAQKRIFALMEKDSLPRFVRSEFYHELIK
ncbi:regulator of G-protein signaling 5-like [Cyanistes caeruleus]|uniref:regulator of G-protein signaling 5-like n=1 Tax=Cyanistes caeruleus TaxID=156563 RepID=UPI000CDAE367|nr:regulator of G-protein signaling 5-like [Cyanistes caeruleus]